MTIERIKSVNGITYEIEYEGYLSPEQRSQVLSQLGSIENISNVSTLATCPSSAKIVGDIVTLSCKPISGTPPYTVVFKKGTTILTTYTNVSEGEINTYNYTTVPGDIGIPTFTVTITDSCPTGAKTVTDTCNVTVNQATCTMLTCTMTGCPMTYMTVGDPVTLTVTPSGGMSPYVYSWQIDGVLQTTTTSSFSPVLTVGTHVITSTVTDSCTNPGHQSHTRSCTITVNAGCGIPNTTFVVS